MAITQQTGQVMPRVRDDSLFPQLVGNAVGQIQQNRQFNKKLGEEQRQYDTTFDETKRKDMLDKVLAEIDKRGGFGQVAAVLSKSSPLYKQAVEGDPNDPRTAAARQAYSENGKIFAEYATLMGRDPGEYLAEISNLATVSGSMNNYVLQGDGGGAAAPPSKPPEDTTRVLPSIRNGEQGGGGAPPVAPSGDGNYHRFDENRNMGGGLQIPRPVYEQPIAASHSGGLSVAPLTAPVPSLAPLDPEKEDISRLSTMEILRRADKAGMLNSLTPGPEKEPPRYANRGEQRAGLLPNRGEEEAVPSEMTPEQQSELYLTKERLLQDYANFKAKADAGDTAAAAILPIIEAKLKEMENAGIGSNGFTGEMNQGSPATNPIPGVPNGVRFPNPSYTTPIGGPTSDAGGIEQFQVGAPASGRYADRFKPEIPTEPGKYSSRTLDTYYGQQPEDGVSRFGSALDTSVSQAKERVGYLKGLISEKRDRARRGEGVFSKGDQQEERFLGVTEEGLDPTTPNTLFDKMSNAEKRQYGEFNMKAVAEVMQGEQERFNALYNKRKSDPELADLYFQMNPEGAEFQRQLRATLSTEDYQEALAGLARAQTSAMDFKEKAAVELQNNPELAAQMEVIKMGHERVIEMIREGASTDDLLKAATKDPGLFTYFSFAYQMIDPTGEGATIKDGFWTAPKMSFKLSPEMAKMFILNSALLVGNEAARMGVGDFPAPGAGGDTGSGPTTDDLFNALN